MPLVNPDGKLTQIFRLLCANMAQVSYIPKLQTDSGERIVKPSHQALASVVTSIETGLSSGLLQVEPPQILATRHTKVLPQATR